MGLAPIGLAKPSHILKSAKTWSLNPNHREPHHYVYVPVSSTGSIQINIFAICALCTLKWMSNFNGLNGKQMDINLT